MDIVFGVKEMSVKPIETCLYVPPIVWKGDTVGHIGTNDVFFYVLEGECFLNIENKNFIVRPGQLAYLPKGKMRAYTHASDNFVMYEMAFYAGAGDKNLMEVLSLMEEDFVIDAPDKDEMSRLFETSHIKELHRNPLYDVGWCANIINIIKIYATERKNQSCAERKLFRPVVEYMTEHVDKNLKTEDMAKLVHMQTTYFIKRFKKTYGLPPIGYFNRMKVYKAMTALAGTDMPIEQIAQSVGITDSAYFARMFKKYCNITPSKYRAEFKRGNHHAK